MDLTMLAGRGSVGASRPAGVAYVFVYPLLSGEARAEKRQKALVGEARGAAPSRARQRRRTGASRSRRA